MLLAAGRGTRLRPFTASSPKILVPVLGVPMLDRLRAYLARGGVTELALNTHHLPEAVQAHLERPGTVQSAVPADLSLALSPRRFHEPALLGTGGALVNAGAYWGVSPLLVWNGDILADVHPPALLAALEAPGGSSGPALGVLVVQDRPSDSHLLVDATGRVCGLDSERRGLRRVLGSPREPVRARAFNGISLLDPGLRARLPVGGAFDLIDALLEVIAAGGLVRAWDAGAALYGTTGSSAQLAALEAALQARPDVLAAWTP